MNALKVNKTAIIIGKQLHLTDFVTHYNELPIC